MAILLAIAAPAAAGQRAPAWLRWAQAHGGFRDGEADARAQGALGRLVLAVPALPRVHVVDDQALGAWAWPGGEVLVTRGLVEAVDDDALAAAIAHEVGHLVLGARVRVKSALAGAGRAGDELAADSMARRLLVGSGLGADALTSLLDVLHARARAGGALREALGERLARSRALDGGP